ncbi:MAG: DUF4328 domain-containing protein [Phycisphaerae bacterium]|nr:DUF4328 domain-containing protein [Phycisphaerae bacterium]
MKNRAERNFSFPRGGVPKPPRQPTWAACFSVSTIDFEDAGAIMEWRAVPGQQAGYHERIGMKIECPQCRSTLTLDDSLAAGRVTCTFCKHTFTPQIRKEEETSVPCPPPLPVGTPATADRANSAAPLPSPFIVTGGNVPPVAGTTAKFVSPTTRARIVVFFAVIYVILCAIGMWCNYLQLDLMNQFNLVEAVETQEMLQKPDITQEELDEKLAAAGIAISNEQTDANIQRMGIFSIVFIAWSLIFLAAFLTWNYRVYKNLKPLKARPIRSTPGGAVGWYFCPIVNLWKPCQLMNDIWLGSNPRKRSFSAKGGPAFVLLWWLVWMGSEILAVTYKNMPGETIEQIIAYSNFYIYMMVLEICWIAITAALILTVSRRQIERQALLVGNGDMDNQNTVAPIA